MLKTYTMAKATLNALYEHELFWLKIADSYEPYSEPWQTAMKNAKEYGIAIEKIFNNNNPAYRTMWNLEQQRKAKKAS